ncbi:uncharacterized protein LOC134449521 [Engraulis encrasicolus]|uniref:uncharacterized protein LOC134449521 n=1 Tax=Engraulis encrasicolus TaxID=184585 RepID=UPI002FD5257D
MDNVRIDAGTAALFFLACFSMVEPAPAPPDIECICNLERDVNHCSVVPSLDKMVVAAPDECSIAWTCTEIECGFYNPGSKPEFLDPVRNMTFEGVDVEKPVQRVIVNVDCHHGQVVRHNISCQFNSSRPASTPPPPFTPGSHSSSGSVVWQSIVGALAAFAGVAGLVVAVWRCGGCNIKRKDVADPAVVYHGAPTSDAAAAEIEQGQGQ